MRPLLAVASATLVGCAAGPRPLPSGGTPGERLAACEEVVTNAAGLSGSFEIQSTGAHSAKLTGTLELQQKNALRLVADGTFDGAPVHLELDARSGELTRSSSKGASVASHHGPVPAELRAAISVGLVRMGLLHNLAQLSADEPVDFAEAGAGVRDALQPLEPMDGGPDSVNGTPCKRVTYALAVKGTRRAEASVCLAEATSLPLERRQTVHFDQGDMSVTERFTWTTAP